MMRESGVLANLPGVGPPLGLGEIPATAEGFVECDHGHEPVAPDPRQEILGRKEQLLGLQHLVVAGQPPEVAAVRHAYALLEAVTDRACSASNLASFWRLTSASETSWKARMAVTSYRSLAWSQAAIDAR